MFKLFAVMCFLVNGATECVDYDDSTAKVYRTLAECEKDAEYRFYGLTDVFRNYNTPYEKIVIGCKEVED
tara:strand:+ start:242 stop:451 length:210 start_codon:yes stop_codon:yes gene_type:complete